MPGINAAPGFWSRMGQAAPGMLNAMAQNYGPESTRSAARGTSSLLGTQKNRAKKPKASMPNTPQVVQMPNVNFGGLMGGGISNFTRNNNAVTSGGLGGGMRGGQGIWNVYNRLNDEGSEMGGMRRGFGRLFY